MQNKGITNVDSVITWDTKRITRCVNSFNTKRKFQTKLIHNLDELQDILASENYDKTNLKLKNGGEKIFQNTLTPQTFHKEFSAKFISNRVKSHYVLAIKYFRLPIKRLKRTQELYNLGTLYIIKYPKSKEYLVMTTKLFQKEIQVSAFQASI